MQLRPGRLAAIVIVVVLILSSYIVELMKYQLVDGVSYRATAIKTTRATTTIPAPRGEILDCYGRTIATNRVGYAVSLNWSLFPTKNQQQENDSILSITKILSDDGETWTDILPIGASMPYTFNNGVDSDIKRLFKDTKIPSTDDAAQTMEALCTLYGISGKYTDAQKRTLAGIRYTMQERSFSLYNPYEFATDVGMITVSKISERSLAMPGVNITQQPIRVYVDGNLAPNVIGYISPIYAEEYPTLKKTGYAMSDLIGRAGIEQSMENYLKGTDGTQSVELNSSGKVISEQVDQAAVPGDTVVLTIDSTLQNQIQAELPIVIHNIVVNSGGDPTYGANANSGAAVVLNIKTGEVLAMASYPSYDLNTYLRNYSQLLKQAGNPLFDRCVSGTYRPGSTFKPVVATAALMYNAITPNTTFFCDHSIYRFGQTFLCDGWHGWEDVIGGLRDSCNIFFYNTGWAVGITKIDKVASALGLGTKTGIELKGEQAGVLSGPEEKNARGGGTWNPGDTLQSSIGQLDNKYTLLQLANYVSTLVKGGTRVKVHVVKKVLTYDYGKTIVPDTTTVESTFPIPASVVQTVMTGMEKVTEEGTGQSVFGDYRMAVGGKTGTAQVPGGYNGLYVGYAPAKDPQIAVAVVVEHGHNGYQTADVAKTAFNEYFFTTNNVSAPVSDDTLLQ